MSTGRRRKKAARRQSVAQWRATATVVPPGRGAPPAPSANGSVTMTATEPLTSPVAVADPTEAPPPRTDPAAAPDDALEDQYAWEDRYDDHRDQRDRDDHGAGYDTAGHDDRRDDRDDLNDRDDVAARRTGRRRVIAVAVAAPLMFAGAFVVGGWIINGVQDQPSRSGPAAAPPPTAPSPSVPATATPSGSGPFVPGSGAGPGLTEPGALVRATPTADGSLEVVERLRFAEPVTELALGPPLTKGVAARSLPRGIEVADLQVQADDAVVAVGVRSLTKARTIQLPDRTSTVVMRYRLIGATARSIPSTPGRALSVLPPITSPATLGQLPFVIEVSGAEVTNVLCPGLPTAIQLCGRTWTHGWYSPPQQPGRTAVLAQLNLPDPVSS